MLLGGVNWIFREAKWESSESVNDFVGTMEGPSETCLGIWKAVIEYGEEFTGDGESLIENWVGL